jgi:hypothetical protein
MDEEKTETVIAKRTDWQILADLRNCVIQRCANCSKSIPANRKRPCSVELVEEALGIIHRIKREALCEELDKIEWFHKCVDAQRNLEMTQKKLAEALCLKNKYKDLLIEACRKQKGEHHETVEDCADM